MFDIGFWEIVLISVIGLVVLGPQRLPIAIRTVLKWVNTAKSMANSVKNEISQELELHEMNENMIKASKQGIDQLDPGLKASIDEMKKSVEELTHPYQKTADDTIKAESASPEKDELPTTSKLTTEQKPQAQSEIASKAVSDQEKS